MEGDETDRHPFRLSAKRRELAKGERKARSPSMYACRAMGLVKELRGTNRKNRSRVSWEVAEGAKDREYILPVVAETSQSGG